MRRKRKLLTTHHSQKKFINVPNDEVIATQQQTVQKPNLKIQNDLYTTYQMMHQKNDY